MQIPKAHREKAILFTDVAVDEKQPATRKESVNSSEITEFVTVGRLDAWRGFDLVIEAMALFVKENQRIHLTYRQRSRRATVKDIDCTVWIGTVCDNGR